MARLPRLKMNTVSAWYHCYARTNGPLGEFPLDPPAAHRKLLEIIRYYVLGYSCHAAGFSVMGNHYHVVLHFEAFRRLSQEELEERSRYFYPKPEQIAHWTQRHWERFNQRLFDVSELMRNIQMVYTKWHNRRFHRRGSFWEGRFKSTLLMDLDAIQECLLYVELNPVRAGLIQRPEQWTRSSAFLRHLKKAYWLLSLKELFPEVDPGQVYQHYRARLLYRGALPTEAGGKPRLLRSRAVSKTAALLYRWPRYRKRGVYSRLDNSTPAPGQVSSTTPSHFPRRTHQPSGTTITHSQRQHLKGHLPPNYP